MSEIDARSMPELRHKPRKCWTLERNSMQRHMSSGAAEKVLQLLSTPRIGVLWDVQRIDVWNELRCVDVNVRFYYSGFNLWLLQVKSELDHMATFLKMAVAYKKKIGFGAQFTIEPKAREPTAHQYDYDAQTVIGFLYQLGAPEGYGTVGSLYSSLISWFTLCRSATLFQKLSKITKTLWFVFSALCCSCLPFFHLGLRHGLQNEFKVNIEPNHTTLAGKL